MENGKREPLSDNTLRRALKAFAAEIEELEGRLRQLKAKRNATLVLLGEEPEEDESVTPPTEQATGPLTPVLEIRNKLMDIFSDDTPRSSGELVSRLEQMGVNLGRKRKDVRIWMTMNKYADDFEKAEGKKWTVKKKAGLTDSEN